MLVTTQGATMGILKGCDYPSVNIVCYSLHHLEPVWPSNEHRQTPYGVVCDPSDLKCLTQLNLLVTWAGAVCLSHC